MLIHGIATGTQAGLSGLGNFGEGLSVSAQFGEAVGDLRRSGLDVVFLFDSTGSMRSTIKGAKEKIRFLITLIETLVPENTRIGLGTYRDHGEGYVVRGKKLTSQFSDLYRFMRSVTASGGGDTPEAVAEALEWALDKNQFRNDAFKVIILIGDAEPHRGEVYDRVLKKLRKFRRRNGSVNSIVTYSRRETQSLIALPAYAPRASAWTMRPGTVAPSSTREASGANRKTSLSAKGE